MKKSLVILLTGILGISTLLTGCGEKASSNTYKADKVINWTVTSGAGGGSDIYTRMISDIMIKEDMLPGSNVIVTNKTDGGGEIGRNETANLKGARANNTLLTFNSGDLMPMIQNTKNRSSNFKIIAIMAVDKQLIFKGKSTAYNDFAEVIEAVKNGSKVVMGGSKGDDIATYEALIEELGVSKDQLTYITYGSTSDAVTALLGGHVEFIIAKPAAASEYVESGDMVPVLACANERFTGNLADAPTLSEIGDYENVEIPVWRGVAASANMSDAAVQFWSEALKKVTETQQWNEDYIEKNKLIPSYMSHEEATTYVTQYEKDFMEQEGIK